MLEKQSRNLVEARKHAGVFSLLFITMANVMRKILMAIRPVHITQVDETALPESNDTTTISLGGSGTSTWATGSSPTSAGDIAALYDREEYPNE